MATTTGNYYVVPFNSYNEIGPFSGLEYAKDYCTDEAFIPLSEVRIVTYRSDNFDAIVVFGPAY